VEGDGRRRRHALHLDAFRARGDPANTRAEARGNAKGDAFGSPDGLWFDPRGVMWIETDAAAAQLNTGEYAGLGNNMMLASDPRTGEIRRFLVGPVNCEITGITATPDMRARCS
jgi:secreted PhoX family phosphatase